MQSHDEPLRRLAQSLDYVSLVVLLVGQTLDTLLLALGAHMGLVLWPALALAGFPEVAAIAGSGTLVLAVTPAGTAASRLLRAELRRARRAGEGVGALSLREGDVQ